VSSRGRDSLWKSGCEWRRPSPGKIGKRRSQTGVLRGEFPEMSWNLSATTSYWKRDVELENTAQERGESSIERERGKIPAVFSKRGGRVQQWGAKR